MPIMDGNIAIDKIRKYYNDCGIPRRLQPIIVCVTGHDTVYWKNLAMEAGSDIVISKPAKYDLIKQIIDRFFTY